MNWFKQQLANVAGTQEPIYGPSAIQPVTDQAKECPYTELKKEGLKWTAMESTCVETQCFYITAASGHIALAQFIYSNLAGLRTTCHFNSKIIYPADSGKDHLWTSDALSDYNFDPEKYCFHASGCSSTLSEDGSFYTIKSSTSDKNVVELKFSRKAPGFVVGKDGNSYYGTDPKEPWGRLRHAIWPRCSVEGTFITKEGPLDMKGSGIFIHALQGMKPHHAAAKWNFANFQSPTYSAILMQYTTPPSYGSTIVSVGGIAVDDKLIYAGAGNTATHTEIKEDDVDWPEPVAAKFEWDGKSGDGQDLHAVLEGSLGPRTDRVDVMAEVPKFVKQIVAGAAGTRPYIYQYTPKLPLKIKLGGEDKEETGQLFMEATFIT